MADEPETPPPEKPEEPPTPETPPPAKDRPAAPPNIVLDKAPVPPFETSFPGNPFGTRAGKREFNLSVFHRTKPAPAPVTGK